ncbi:MAG TPA: HAD-IIB family hydrolase, partial [Gemmataceae bacterium]|nr:HAD-IIB family hydrolase [Gemmataceae bacterium]
MRYLALAVDYDGTLARDGLVSEATVRALEQVVASGRTLVLVTGRQLEDLLQIFPQVSLFDRVVAENGALLYRPTTREMRALAEPAPAPFVEELRRRGVAPLAVGAAIVATVHPNESVLLKVIRELGLELQLVFNKGAVMVLPANVNKASGLMAALDELRLSPHNTVAIGDAENDHALLGLAEYSVAVSNAVPMLKEGADRVLTKPNGAGVVELIDDLLANDLAASPPRVHRRKLLLGLRDNGEEVNVRPAHINLLVAGPSGSGKSTFATGVLERLAAQGYQFCIVDPEGDYENFDDAIVFGSTERGPSATEILTALEKPDANVAVNLIGLPLQDRPRFFLTLLPRLLALRAKTGRPHWILVDEAHHLMPADWQLAPAIFTQDLTSMIYVTVHPDLVAPVVLGSVDVVAALGDAPASILGKFCEIGRVRPPAVESTEPEAGRALLWLKG